MLLLPLLARRLGRRDFLGDVMQPAVPGRRDLRGFGLALVVDEATLRIVLEAVVLVAELIGSDQFALPPQHEPGSQRTHGRILRVEILEGLNAPDYGTAARP